MPHMNNRHTYYQLKNVKKADIMLSFIILSSTTILLSVSDPVPARSHGAIVLHGVDPGCDSGVSRLLRLLQVSDEQGCGPLQSQRKSVCELVYKPEARVDNLACRSNRSE